MVIQMKHTILIILVMSMLFSPYARAENTKKIAKIGDWSLFSYLEKGGKVCYAVSKPKKSLNSPKNRSDSYVTITDRVSDKSQGVFSSTEGFVLKKDGNHTLNISGSQFDLYLGGDTLWARNDKVVLAAMLKNRTMTVNALPQKGDSVVDTYSLEDFSKVWNELGKACGLH